MSEQTFEYQIVKTLQFEGGYANDPDDPGGETNFGISKAAYPDVDIANLSKEDAIAIYHRDYWLRPHCDQLPDNIAGKVFDMCVNMGPVPAIRCWQQTINHLSQEVPGVTEDGLIGPATIKASEQTFSTDPLDAYKAILVQHYLLIIRAHPGLARFQRGWLRRANA